MKNSFKYIIAALAVTLSVSAAYAAVYADGDDTRDYKAAISATKIATVNSDGTITLTLETYMKGSHEVTSMTTRKPVEAVLVLDCSGSMNEPIEYVTIKDTDGTEKTSWKFSDITYNASASNVGVDQKQYIKLEGGQYCSVKYKSSGSTRQVYYSNGGKKYYLTKDGITTTETSVSTSDIIYSGVLYKTANDGETRMSALRTAAINFVRVLAKDAATNGNVAHKVSLISFGDVATTVQGLQALDTAAIKSAINGLPETGRTYSNLGLDAALTQVGNMSSDATRLVVMFTDGVPGSNSFIEETANNAISISKLIKNHSTKKTDVYTVGIFGEDITNNVEEYSKVRTYMNYVSSNYPNASSMTEGGDQIATPKYFFDVTSADQLKSVFEGIAEEATDHAGADIVIETENVEIRDVISSNFQLPANADASSIKLYTSKCTNVAKDGNGEYVLTFDSTKTPLTDASVSIEDNTVTVSNYDLSKNWCGPSIKNDKITGPNGKKLIITFDVVPSPECTGGCMKTNNDDLSGVYVNGSQGADFTCEVKYVVNSIVSPVANLVIQKTGLKYGESAIFKVSGGGNTYRVAVTATELGSTISTGDSKYCGETILKVPAYDASEPNGADNPYEYTVTEESWAWAYNEPAAEPQTHALYDRSKKLTNTFSFAAGTDNSKGIKHDEDPNTVDRTANEGGSQGGGEGGQTSPELSARDMQGFTVTGSQYRRK